MVFPQKIMSPVIHPTLAFMLPYEVVGMVAEFLDVKDMGSLCAASYYFNEAVCSIQRLQKQFPFALHNVPCLNDDDGDDTSMPMEECLCDHHHFIIHWVQVQNFRTFFLQYSPQLLFRCVCHVRVDVMRFTRNPWSRRVESADDFPVFLDVIGVTKALPAMHKLDVHFSGRYYKIPWPQPLMDRNEEEASHVRAIQEFCSGQKVLVQVTGREVIETIDLW